MQPNAGVYCTDLAAHAAAILSFALAIVSIRSSRPPAKVLLAIMAGLLELLYLGIFESAIGLEVGRLAILGYVVWVQGKEP